MFSNDSKKIFFTTDKDSLCILELNNTKIISLDAVTSYKMAAFGNWLAYLHKGDSRKLILYNIEYRSSSEFVDVLEYYFSPNGQALIIKTNEKQKNGSVVQKLTWISLVSHSQFVFWVGLDSRRLVFDASGSKLVFVEENGNTSNMKRGICFYRLGSQFSIKLIDDSVLLAQKGLIMTEEELAFNNDGDRIIFKAFNSQTTLLKRHGNLANIEIWSYSDSRAEIQDRASVQKDSRYLVIDIKGDHIIQATNDGERKLNSKGFKDYLLLANKLEPDYFYSSAHFIKYSLLDTRNGERVGLPIKKVSSVDVNEIRLSPDERFVIWFDWNVRQYFSYEINTHIVKNIGGEIKSAFYDQDAYKVNRHETFGIAGWDTHSSSVYLYDQFDIWKVDLMKNGRTICITNHFGRKNHIDFGLVTNSDLHESFFDGDGKALVTGYKRNTKENGFYEINAGKFSNPVKLTMEHCAYFISRIGITGYVESAKGFKPIKAKDATVYLVKKMTASSFPNLYVTTDFKKYRALSDFHPEKKYNWLTSELVTWTMSDGKKSQGILYKPENFDPNRKYPLIFDYYEKRSDALHLFIEPVWSSSRINIPYFVSNGYLVFVPDIYYKPGHNGESLVNSVVSAAKYLSARHYVDGKKIGLQGHSFGGWETNYLITHTSDFFAAACEASGVSDQISGYNQLSNITKGTNRQSLYELNGQGSPFGVGVTPWTHPRLYSDNSPVLSVGNVTTPLLMMHGDNDAAVPFPQAVELFLALRRAGKKVWLLKYKGAEHFVTGNDAKDFTFRMKGFFDHYLKNALMPDWMKPIDEQNSSKK